MAKHLRPDTISRRWLLAGLLASAASPLLAEAPLSSILPRARPTRTSTDAIPRKVQAQTTEALIAAAKLGGSVGFLVADAKTGLVLEQAGGTTNLPPASVAKTMTALYALDALGADYRFSTKLIATGPVQNGKIAGDLILAGGGDPTLSTDMLAAMAKALKGRGITGVSGRFLVWGGALPNLDQIDPGQPAQVGYNPSISGLNLNYNRVYFEWRRGGNGYLVSMDARSDLYRPAISMATMKVIDRPGPLYTYDRAGAGDAWTVMRAGLGDGGSRWLPVRNPALYAGEAFQSLAAAQGIALPDPKISNAAPRGTALVEQKSDDLRSILRDMLRYSTNMTAEIVGLTASLTKGPTPSLKASASRMSDWLAQTRGVQGVQFVDHSGLGSASRISPHALVQALTRAGPDGTLRSILRDYPLRDVAGAEVKGSRVRISAKTGTLNFVSGLAGYITTADGATLVFAIFCADAARRDAVPMADREQPPGGQAWTRRARALQQSLITRWVAVYGA